MSNEEEQFRARPVDRREFCGIALSTAAALATLPAASLVLAGCGSGEERGEAAVPAPSAPSEQADEAASPPQATEPPPAPAEEGDGRLVTEVAAAASIVSALQYVNESAKPDQNCSNCQLYIAGADQRGKCQLFAQGLVKETGWCVSWVARIT